MSGYVRIVSSGTVHHADCRTLRKSNGVLRLLPWSGGSGRACCICLPDGLPAQRARPPA